VVVGGLGKLAKTLDQSLNGNSFYRGRHGALCEYDALCE
jgi:hypothetical protein